MRKPPIATFGLCLALVLTMLWERHQLASDAIIAAYAFTPYNLTQGVWPLGGLPAPFTLLSSLFLHAGPVHLAGNVAVMLLVGPLIERRCRTIDFLIFFLFCGVMGSLLETAADPRSHVPLLGASGAIAGCMGAIAVRCPLQSVLGLPVVVPIVLWAGFQIADGLIPTLTASGAGAQSSIAYLAHVGGLLCGLFTIGIFERSDSIEYRR